MHGSFTQQDERSSVDWIDVALLLLPIAVMMLSFALGANLFNL